MTVKYLKFNPRLGWVDTGVNVTAGERIHITASGKVSAYDRKIWADYFGDEEWNDPEGSPTNILVNVCGGTLAPSLPDMMLIGKIGENGSIFPVGRRYLQTASTSGSLRLTVNDCAYNFPDNRGYFNIKIITGLPGKPRFNAPCPLGNDQKQRSQNPIELADGNKVLTITDFSLQTTAGKLAFEREYNQAQNSNVRYQFMGMGWSHNHLYTLVLAGVSPNRTADIFLPNGGVLKLDENGPGQFVAQAGSSASMSVSGANYLLAAQDNTVYEFEPSSITNQFRLKNRKWATTETWAYIYSNDKLTLIDDGYGRQLKFSYVVSAGYDNGQLWRVGDQTAAGLDTTTPSGRYVELGYTPEKNNGVTVSNPKALLATVRDVRTYVWTYSYYGQVSGENNTAQLNLMTKRLSPSVDTTGDGVVDDVLTLEELGYMYSGTTLSQVVQKRGNALLETTFDIRPNGHSETRESVAGVPRIHIFTDDNGENGAYLGEELNSTSPINYPVDDAISEISAPDLNFRPQGQIDGQGNVTTMDWSADGKRLNGVTDALNNHTTFTYNANDTLKESVDAQNRKTEYHYGNAQQPRLPTRVRTFDTNGTTVLRWQEFSYDTKGRTLTEELRDPVGGVTVLQRASRTYGTSGTANGLLASVTQEDLLQSANNSTTLYTYDSAGRVVKTQKTSLFGTCEFSYTVYDPAGNVLAAVCGPQNVTPPTTVAEAIAMYAVNNDNKVTTYDYDSLGRRIKVTNNAGAAFAQTTLTFYDALDRIVRTIIHYVNQSGGDPENPALWVWSTANERWEKSFSDTTPISHGVENTQNVISDTSYNARNLLRRQMDAAGHVVLYGYDKAGRLIKTIQSASAPGYNNDYIGSGSDPTLDSYSPSAQADQDIIVTNEHNAAGNRVKTTDALNRVTYTVYDALNRPIKTVRNAKDTATVLVYDNDPDYIAANDPRSSNYAPGTDPDRDLIETTEYDALGRVVRTQSLVENRSVQEWSATLFGYDALGRQAKVIRSASNPAYSVTADPDLSDYAVSFNPDQDIVTRTLYDTQGRVLFTVDTLGGKIRFVYDGMNRQVKTIANFTEQGEDPALWVWSSTNSRWQKSSGTAISHGEKNDQNIVTESVYDSDGHLLEMRDVLGRVSRSVYDGSGRLVRTIRNYVVQGTSDPLNWVYNNGWKQSSAGGAPAVSHGADNDENQVSSTAYDSQGRVIETRDHRDNASRNVYDALGRRVKTITNYVAQGTTDPANWVWSVGNNRWENGAGVAINYGAEKDQNRIASTAYDILGRATRSRDAAGIETRTDYDAVGRIAKTTVNFVDGNFNLALPDEDLISTTTYDKGGQVISATDARGTQTSFGYDKTGRRLTATQAAGSPLATTQYTCYDKAGRVLRTISNWSNDPDKPLPDEYNALTRVWSFVPDHNGQFNDRDLITVYEYDRLNRQTKVTDSMGQSTTTSYLKDGQVNTLTDPEAVTTRYVYDQLRRRYRVVQAHTPQSVSQRIAFRENVSGGQMYSMNADGSGVLAVTSDSSGTHGYPQWSPDGSRIAYRFVSLTGNGRIRTIHPSGAAMQELTGTSGWAINATWSPDGRFIAYLYSTGGPSSTPYIMNADGTNARQIINTPILSGMSWSPDGQRLLFQNGSSILQVMNVDGSELRDLKDSLGNPITGYTPVWSPDGSRIAYNYLNNVIVINTDGTNKTTLATGASPSWSPDGTKITYCVLSGGTNELYVMNANGTGVTRLTNNATDDSDPDWSPGVIDPAFWFWNNTSGRWEYSTNLAVNNGANNDQNIVVDLTYDRAGRVISQREPRGNVTTYAYDKLNRRKSLTNPFSKTWMTAYADTTDGKTQTTLTLPGITGSTNYPVVRQFDRLGRPLNINYGAPGVTPDVAFTYDNAGNRVRMSEFSAAGFTSRIRETTFGYDEMRRLASVGFDQDGNGTVDQAVTYQYDAGGLRTRLTLPGGLNVHYTYDAKGRLVSLTDWDNQQSGFAYDNVGRHVATERANGLLSRYQYDAGGRLRLLRHTRTNQVLAHFAYEVDKRGNRTQATEMLAQPATTNDVTISSTDKGIITNGTWTDVSGFKETSAITASLLVGFVGDEAALTMGTGPDHGFYDVYMDGSLWQSFDGYAAAASQRDILIPLGVDSRKLSHEGPHVLEIRVRTQRHPAASGNKVRFKQLLVADRSYALHTIRYSYDALARLREARYAPGLKANAVDADLLRRYQYTFDLSGNRTQQIVTVAGSATTTNYGYNAANQMTSAGAATLTYDHNGNLTNDGAAVYTWDRANRMIGAGSVQLAYDGAGNQVKRTDGANVTQVLLDLQPGLAVTLSQTSSANTERYLHAPRGIHAQKDAAGNWEYPVQDGLGSVRGVADNAMIWSAHYDPFGTSFGANGTEQTTYGFTGEQYDPLTDLLYLRARHYKPGLGQFTALDPFEGQTCAPMSLNGYSWVEGNSGNLTDSSGTSPFCGIPFVKAPLILYRQTPITSSCQMRSSSAVDVLAYTASLETSAQGEGSIRSDHHALAALMLMQINAFRTPNQTGSSGYWTPIGVSGPTAQRDFVNRARSRSDATEAERALATLFVDGYCEHNDPLYFFSPAAGALDRQFASESYPQVVANYSNLVRLASAYGNYETALKNEISIHADRADDIVQYWPDVYVVAGASRAVVITTAGQTRPPLLYQCPSSAVEVTPAGNPDRYSSLSPTRNHTCHNRCSYAEYWIYLGLDRQAIADRIGISALRDQVEVGGNYARVSREDYRKVRVPERYSYSYPAIGSTGADYVATCN